MKSNISHWIICVNRFVEFEKNVVAAITEHIDVMTELAKDMGVKLKFVPTEWKTLINGIIADKYDISTSASVTPQRIRTVGFTKSYYQVTTVPLTLKKNLAQFKDWEDISYPSVTLTVTLGTSQEQYVENVFSPINHRFTGTDPQGQRTHRDCLPAFGNLHGSGFRILDPIS
jgi:hypothetical protein